MGTVAQAPRPSESGHFYDRQGNAVYEVIAKGTGRMRPATLADARRLGLVPGVSTIVRMEAAPQLEKWKITQALLAAVTLPRKPGESDDAFVERAREDSFEQARKAADRGTEVHAAIQAFFESRSYKLEYAPHVDAVANWVSQRFGLGGWFAEKSFAHPSGYGGKCDIISFERETVLDLKGKDFDETTKDLVKAYPENCMQLAAYAQGQSFTKPTCANIFFSRTVPGLIVVREWDDAELAEGLEAFNLLLRLHQIRKKYDGSFTRQAA